LYAQKLSYNFIIVLDFHKSSIKTDMEVHTYNPSFACKPSSLGSGGRKIKSLRPVWAKEAVGLCLKNKIKPEGMGM
jgi:hypothetical protein